MVDAGSLKCATLLKHSNALHLLPLPLNVCEISHTNIKVIIIRLICCTGWFYARGRRLFFTANQTAAHQQPGRHAHALKQSAEPRARVFVRRARRSRTITGSQQLKSKCHESQGRPPSNVNTHKAATDRICCSSGWLSSRSPSRPRQRHLKCASPTSQAD